MVAVDLSHSWINLDVVSSIIGVQSLYPARLENNPSPTQHCEQQHSALPHDTIITSRHLAG